MEELKTRSFIDSYKIKNFAGKTLIIEIQTYVDINVLIKKNCKALSRNMVLALTRVTQTIFCLILHSNQNNLCT